MIWKLLALRRMVLETEAGKYRPKVIAWVVAG